MKNFSLVAIGIFFLGACSIMPGSGWWSGISFDTNGERIYFTSTNDAGKRISYLGGSSLGSMMMASQFTCASWSWR